ncbi:sugar phosphate nucleotidyltransferase [Mitsuokella sp.]|uniref:sugar phosphate nucleotidyltransferase n=1 Tax=Mitsuokella sp. TaxID=2049034 RepID=UPI003D7EBFF1
MKHKTSRYIFELLSFIEEQDRFIFEKRNVADALCMSCGCISEVYQSLLEQGCIEEVDGYTVITNTGLAVLEPYRVKRAVILAAGFGSRMMPATAERPKPMVMVNGRHIIETLLDALVAADIKDITIVRGYHKEKFDELLVKYPFLHFIDNDDYDKTNNISSAILAHDYFHGGAYLCESDLYITNPAVIRKYQYTSNILGSYSLQTDDWSFKMDDDGHIKDYQKGNTFCWNYYGISYWTAEDCEKLNHDWQETFKVDTDVFWEQVPLQLKKEDYAVEIRPCRKQDIIEIDNYDELAMLDPSYR